MKILLLGGTGVLSADILKNCLSHNYEVSVLNRGSHNCEIKGDVKVYQGDVRDTELLAKIFRNQFFDIVVDFLSYNANQLKDTLSFFEDKCQQFIFISSCCVFRRAKEDFPITEISEKPNPNLGYGVRKYEAEEWLKSNKFKCNWTIVRPYVTYGDTRIPFGIAPPPRLHWTIIARLIAGKPFFVWTENEELPVCTLTHTTDFARLFQTLFLNPQAYNTDVNIVGDERHTWKEVIESICDIIGIDQKRIKTLDVAEVKEELLSFREFLTGDRNLNAIFDNKKIKEISGNIGCNISLKEGIARTINSYSSNAFYDGIDYKYDALVDRLMSRYTSKRIKFIDYLGNATLIQKMTYFIYRNLGERNGNRIINRLKKYFHR